MQICFGKFGFSRSLAAAFGLFCLGSAKFLAAVQRSPVEGAWISIIGSPLYITRSVPNSGLPVIKPVRRLDQHPGPGFPVQVSYSSPICRDPGRDSVISRI